MKLIMALYLIVIGLILVLYANVLAKANELAASSDAAQFEYKLKTWAESKIVSGKLQQSDVSELFPDGYSLRFGGENENRNFREMISHISRKPAPPSWIGLLSLFLGVAGVIDCFVAWKTKCAEQAAIV